MHHVAPTLLPSEPVNTYNTPVHLSAPVHYNSPVHYSTPVHYNSPVHYSTPVHYNSPVQYTSTSTSMESYSLSSSLSPTHHATAVTWPQLVFFVTYWGFINANGVNMRDVRSSKVLNPPSTVLEGFVLPTSSSTFTQHDVPSSSQPYTQQDTSSTLSHQHMTSSSSHQTFTLLDSTSTYADQDIITPSSSLHQDRVSSQGLTSGTSINTIHQREPLSSSYGHREEQGVRSSDGTDGEGYNSGGSNGERSNKNRQQQGNEMDATSHLEPSTGFPPSDTGWDKQRPLHSIATPSLTTTAYPSSLSQSQTSVTLEGESTAQLNSGSSQINEDQIADSDIQNVQSKETIQGTESLHKVEYSPTSSSIVNNIPVVSESDIYDSSVLFLTESTQQVGAGTLRHTPIVTLTTVQDDVQTSSVMERHYDDVVGRHQLPERIYGGRGGGGTGGEGDHRRPQKHGDISVASTPGVTTNIVNSEMSQSVTSIVTVGTAVSDSSKTLLSQPLSTVTACSRSDAAVSNTSQSPLSQAISTDSLVGQSMSKVTGTSRSVIGNGNLEQTLLSKPVSTITLTAFAGSITASPSFIRLEASTESQMANIPGSFTKPDADQLSSKHTKSMQTLSSRVEEIYNTQTLVPSISESISLVQTMDTPYITSLYPTSGLSPQGPLNSYQEGSTPRLHLPITSIVPGVPPGGSSEILHVIRTSAAPGGTHNQTAKPHTGSLTTDLIDSVTEGVTLHPTHILEYGTVIQGTLNPESSYIDSSYIIVEVPETTTEWHPMASYHPPVNPLYSDTLTKTSTDLPLVSASLESSLEVPVASKSHLPTPHSHTPDGKTQPFGNSGSDTIDDVSKATMLSLGGILTLPTQTLTVPTDNISPTPLVQQGDITETIQQVTETVYSPTPLVQQGDITVTIQQVTETVYSPTPLVQQGDITETIQQVTETVYSPTPLVQQGDITETIQQVTETVYSPTPLVQQGDITETIQQVTETVYSPTPLVQQGDITVTIQQVTETVYSPTPLVQQGDITETIQQVTERVSVPAATLVSPIQGQTVSQIVSEYLRGSHNPTSSNTERVQTLQTAVSEILSPFLTVEIQSTPTVSWLTSAVSSSSVLELDLYLTTPLPAEVTSTPPVHVPPDSPCPQPEVSTPASIATVSMTTISDSDLITKVMSAAVTWQAELVTKEDQPGTSTGNHDNTLPFITSATVTKVTASLQGAGTKRGDNTYITKTKGSRSKGPVTSARPSNTVTQTTILFTAITTAPARPRVYVTFKLRMTWTAFCSRVDEFKRVLKSTLNKSVHDNYKVVVNGECSNIKNVARRSVEITVDVYLADKDGRYDIHMTSNFARRIKKNRYLLDQRHGSFKGKFIKVVVVGLDVSNNLLAKQKEPSPAMTTAMVAGIAVASILSSAIMALIIAQMVIIAKRRSVKKMRAVGYDSSRPSIDVHSLEESIHMISIATIVGGISYVNPAMDSDEHKDYMSNPLTLTDLEELLSDPDSEDIEDEFLMLPNPMPKISEVPEGVEDKNRYANVIPIHETRVPLVARPGSNHSDYINANYVRGYGGKSRMYIATQAPMDNTRTDFWEMIWQQQTQVILMLTGLEENGHSKCSEYWPNTEGSDVVRIYGDYHVQLQLRDVTSFWIRSVLILKNMETNLRREVQHLWLTTWPPSGVPEDPCVVLAFLEAAEPYILRSHGPPVVHCSPGTGRTGTLLAVDMGRKAFDLTHCVDVLHTVRQLREDRAGAIQTKEQYNFVHKALLEYAMRVTDPSTTSMTSSLISETA